MTQALTGGDPRRLGAFEIVGRLGEGGQGVVYLGRGPSGEPVAVKLLHARLSQDGDASTRFLREVEVARRVARFCTASVLHADVAGDRPYIVSEYVPGPSLRLLVEREGPRRGAALDRVAVSTATALAAIHRAGILHRDFKPANVLMGPEGPVVIDFGVARALDTPGATLTADTIGTPSYLAPEQLGGGPLTPAVDVFAWGVTIVYAAGGRPAFGADSIPAVINRILHEPPDLRALDGPLRELVAACLAKDPARRPTAEQVVSHLMGRPFVPPPAPREPRRLRPVLVPVAAGVAAAVLAAGVTLALRTGAASPQAPPPVVAGVEGGEEPSAERVSTPPVTPSRRTRTPAPRPSRPATARTSRAPAPSPSRTRTPSPTPSPTPSTVPSVTPTPKPSATPKPSPSPEPNPYTAAQVCGPGYTRVAAHALGTRATVVLMYDATAGRNCVVTLARHVAPQKVRMSAVLKVRDGASQTDGGAFTAYAGPVRLAAKKTCVIWGGSHGGTSWQSGWSHCG